MAQHLNCLARRLTGRRLAKIVPYTLSEILWCPGKSNTLWVAQTVALLCENVMIDGLDPALNINGPDCVHGEQRPCNSLVEFWVCVKDLKEAESTLDITVSQPTQPHLPLWTPCCAPPALAGRQAREEECQKYASNPPGGCRNSSVMHGKFVRE